MGWRYSHCWNWPTSERFCQSLIYSNLLLSWHTGAPGTLQLLFQTLNSLIFLSAFYRISFLFGKVVYLQQTLLYNNPNIHFLSSAIERLINIKISLWVEFLDSSIVLKLFHLDLIQLQTNSRLKEMQDLNLTVMLSHPNASKWVKYLIENCKTGSRTNNSHTKFDISEQILRYCYNPAFYFKESCKNGKIVINIKILGVFFFF